MTLGLIGRPWGGGARYATSFPVAARPWEEVVRSDLDGVKFYYDVARAVWLSEWTFELAFTNQATVSAGAGLRLYQANVGSSTTAYQTKWTCVLTEIVGHRDTSGSATDIYLRDGVSNLKTHTIGSGVVNAVETGLNIAVASGALLNAYANTAMTGGGHVVYTFHRSAT